MITTIHKILYTRDDIDNSMYHEKMDASIEETVDASI